MSDWAIATDQGLRHCPTPGCAGVLCRPSSAYYRVWILRVSTSLATLLVAVFAAIAGLGLAWSYGYPWQLPMASCTGSAVLGVVLALSRTQPLLLRRPLRTRCGACEQDACFTCGERWHPRSDCAEDLVENWALARDAERCPRCGT